ncbi:MAG: hypothetical protein DRH12_18570 [Deltaproteobacteria bacterium]|nr:MAG: hypothetical protein DRH12_18570 [Deltaproteobacteria bacterium]
MTMRRIADWLKSLLGLGALAVLTVVLVLLFRPAGEGEPVAQQQSPIGTPSPPEISSPTPTKESPFVSPLPTPTPTRWNWEPTATAMARITPTPFTLPTPTPIGGLTTPTPALGPPPPTMVPPKAFRAEDLEVADVRFVDFDARFEFVGWSPDGTHILIELADPAQSKWHWRKPGSGLFLHDLWTMKADGTERRKVADWVGCETWSPDGKYIAYSVPAKDEGIEGGIYVADVETLKSWKVADSDFTGVLDMYWLPSGELTFLKGGHIFAVQSDGTETRQLNDIYITPITTEQPVPGIYELSPDGRKIAWVPGESAKELWIANLDGSQATMVTDNCYRAAGPQGIAWSPNSRYLAFTLFGRYEPISGDLWVVNADGSDPHPIVVAEREWDELIAPTWSPDSQAIAFVRGQESSLWIVNRDGSGLRPLGESRMGFVLFPHWSPKGTQIGYSRLMWEPSGLPNAAIITLQQKP